MTNRTLVVSIDALITADIPVLKQLPNLGRVMEHASWITDIECIYPTLTYPCHATIATGCWPDRTGINNNEIPDFLQRDGWTGIGGGRPFRCLPWWICKTGGADCLYRHLARHVRLRSGVQYWRDLGPAGGG